LQENFQIMSNIVDVVVADKNLATMSKSVKAAGLETELAEKGPFTVFAPTDMAFGKLKEGEMKDLMKPENKVKLQGVVNYHLVEGKRNLNELKDGQKLQTINGKQLSVRVHNGEVSINGSRLQGQEHEASNGVVYSIDKVISGN
jgi:uncharacterized surface protein with fasciclin (FAS1) repeats